MREKGITHRSQKSLELLVLMEPGGQLAATLVLRLLHLGLDLPQPVDLLVQHSQLTLLGCQVFVFGRSGTGRRPGLGKKVLL